MMSAELKYWYLRDHQLFRNLTQSEINALGILKKFKRSRKEELIDLPFTDRERVYFLKHGKLKLLRLDPQGQEVLLDVLQKGDLFGDLSFQNSNKDQDYLRVITDEVVICSFYKDKLEELIHAKPDFALNYIKFMGFHFRRVQNSYRNILFRDAKSRLLLLLKTFLDQENVTENSCALPNYLTQKDIAQLICTTRQTVIALIKELQHDGILLYSQKEIVILNVNEFVKLIQNVK